jgi:hypothetical protein
MDQPCPTCGSVGADGAACACPAPPATYSPPLLWHVFGIVGWILTVGAVLSPTPSTADMRGQLTGVLFVPVAMRVVYVMQFARGPRVWSRALFSPWVWAIAIALNVMAAGGHHPH